MAMINVNPDIQDEFYRYKMPKLNAKVEGKGNGIKTVVTNMKEIATAVGRPPMYPTKFFGCELGAQTQFDPKNERYIVNGSHDAARLQELLFVFNRKFVLCSSCENPETQFSVKDKKRGIVNAKCRACGHAYQIDPAHRLTQYIAKNPPTEEAQGMATGDGKRGTHTKSKRSREQEDQEGEEGNEEIELDVPEEGGGSGSGGDEDLEWSEDATTEAAAQRMSALSGAVRALAMDANVVDRTPSERADMFFSFVSSMKDREKEKIADRAKDIKAEADRLDLNEKIVVILAEVLWTNPDTLLSEDIKRYAPIFRYFTANPRADTSKAQRYVIGAMEKTIARFEKSLLPKAIVFLKSLYDYDIVEEENILQWADKGPSKRNVSRQLSKTILANCEKFIEWLKTADEETSDEEEEEEEADINSKVSNGGKPVTNGQKTNGTAVADEEDDDNDDDLDIDAI